MYLREKNKVTTLQKLKSHTQRHVSWGNRTSVFHQECNTFQSYWLQNLEFHLTFPISSSPSSNQSLNPVDSLFGFSNSHLLSYKVHDSGNSLLTDAENERGFLFSAILLHLPWCRLTFLCVIRLSDRPLLYKNQAKAMNVEFKALRDLTPSSFHSQALLSPLLIPSNCSSLSPPQLSKGPLLSYGSSGQIPSVDWPSTDLHSFISTSKLSANPAGSAFRIHPGSDYFSSSMLPY